MHNRAQVTRVVSAVAVVTVVISHFYSESNPPELYLNCATEFVIGVTAIMMLLSELLAALPFVIFGPRGVIYALVGVIGAALLVAVASSIYIFFDPEVRRFTYRPAAFAYWALAIIVSNGLILSFANQWNKISPGEHAMNPGYYVFPVLFALFGVYYSNCLRDNDLSYVEMSKKPSA